VEALAGDVLWRRRAVRTRRGLCQRRETCFLSANSVHGMLATEAATHLKYDIIYANTYI
jgi:hypothetical protein